jgi:hypothetical protein
MPRTLEDGWVRSANDALLTLYGGREDPVAAGWSMHTGADLAEAIGWHMILAWMSMHKMLLLDAGVGFLHEPGRWQLAGRA